MAMAALSSSSDLPPLSLGFIEGALKRWVYTKNLKEEEIRYIALSVIKYFIESPSSDIQSRSISWGKVKVLCSKTKEGDLVVYFSSKVRGGSIARPLLKGSFKGVSERLEIAFKKNQGVVSSLVALVKPLEDEINFRREADLLNRCQHLPGLIRLKNWVSYSKGDVSKMRMVLPWYSGDLFNIRLILNLTESAEVCRQILLILAGFEKEGWVFRDVKFDNILFNSEETTGIEVVFCDPGLMCSSGSFFIVDDVLGNINWLPPEYASLVWKQQDFSYQIFMLQDRFEMITRREHEAGFNYKQEMEEYSKLKTKLLKESESFAEKKKEQLQKWATSKLDVWSAGMICAFFFKKEIWDVLREEINRPISNREKFRISSEWMKLGSIPKIEGLYPADPLADFIKQMLHPDPEKRLTASESSRQFSALLAAGKVK